MIQLTPPMGWNSWNTFGEKIDETMIREMADAMVSTGLLEAGYNYLVIDDCWAELTRDENNRLVASREKFPNGMKAVADYVHSKGLKFGMYSCAGTLTCAGYPGSFEYEFIDAQTFAEWGVDFLKYDYCYHPKNVPGATLYQRMGAALATCGRDILFSACSWGADETYKWIKTTGAHMWRSTGDIVDSWESIRDLYNKQIDLQVTNGQGCFNDMDMLVVGMKGKGNVGLTGCTTEEYRTHFSLWAMFGSPLMIGCDIREMDEDTRAILMNKDVIAINQDPAARQLFAVNSWPDDSTPKKSIWVRMLEGGDYAIGMFNMEECRRMMAVNFSDIGIGRATGKTLELHDVWSGETFRPANNMVRTLLEPHTCRLYRAKVVDA